MNYKKIIIVLIIFICLGFCFVICNYKKTYSVVKVISNNRVIERKGYGIIYKKNDYTYIVTNYHIIKNSNSIKIKYGNIVKKALLVNGDEYEDLAVLKINNNKSLKKAKFDNHFEVNDKVWISNRNQKKYGEITKKNNKVLVKLSSGNYLINSIKLKMNISNGDSGKPLYNTNNRVIGLITMKNTKNTNIGYAIDIKHVLNSAEILEKSTLKRPDIGVKIVSCNNDKVLESYNLDNHNLKGVIVIDSYDSKELIKGDIIVKINNHKIDDIVHFKYYLYNSKKIDLTIYRNGKYVNKKINNLVS